MHPKRALNSFLVVSILLGLCLPLLFTTGLRDAAKTKMKIEAVEIASLVDNIRTYYSQNIVSNVQEGEGKVVLSERYHDVKGGIPIPATLSIELGTIFDATHSDGRINYAFTSKYPFNNRREERVLDAFQQDSIQFFEKDPTLQSYEEYSQLGQDEVFRLATPVRMKESCVTCHNAHPDSPKKTWKVGDLRGIQEVSIKSVKTAELGYMNSIFYTALIASVVGIAGLLYSRSLYSKSSNVIRNLKYSLDSEIKNISDVTKILDESEIFKEAIEKSSVGITISDMTTEGYPTIYVNQAFTELTGYSREFVLGKNCRFLQGPDTEVSVKAQIKDAIAKGERFQCVITNYRSDGTKFKNNLVLIPIFSDSSRINLSYYLANQSVADA